MTSPTPGASAALCSPSPTLFNYAGLNPLEIRGADWAGFPLRKRNGLLRAAFAHWRHAGFPYFQLTDAQVASDFKRLQKQDIASVFRADSAIGSSEGLRLANNFQPSMWSVRVSRYRCPMEVFLDDDLLLKALARAWTIWPDRLGVNSSNLRRMLKTFTHTAAVSNFRPTLTRAIVKRFSPPGGTVLDFAAGFGGRLVGCLTLDRTYIGIEPHRAQVQGLRQTIHALRKRRHENSSARIYQGCAERILPRIDSESADLVLSSPPYYDWERYAEDETQSFIRYSAYENWLAGFLHPCIEESYRALRPKGRLVLNVSGKDRRPTRSDVLQLAKQTGFRLLQEIPMLLARVPYLHPRNLGAYKPELLLIFRK